MKKTAVLACFLLSGCASAAFDPSAVASASRERSTGYDRCNSVYKNGFAGNGKSTPLLTCVLIVEKEWASAIKLKDMGLYNFYATRLKLMAAEADAGRISIAERNKQQAAAQTDYFASIRQAYEGTQRQNDNTGSALALMGTALMSGFNAGRAAPSPPISTSCTTIGVVTNCTTMAPH